MMSSLQNILQLVGVDIKLSKTAKVLSMILFPSSSLPLVYTKFYSIFSANTPIIVSIS
jgi:hypothetical protein